MSTCKDCLFFNFKASVPGLPAVGRCENQTVGKGILPRLDLGAVDIVGADKFAALRECLDFRVTEDFGCIHYEKEPA